MTVTPAGMSMGNVSPVAALNTTGGWPGIPPIAVTVPPPASNATPMASVSVRKRHWGGSDAPVGVGPALEMHPGAATANAGRSGGGHSQLGGEPLCSTHTSPLSHCCGSARGGTHRHRPDPRRRYTLGLSCRCTEIARRAERSPWTQRACCSDGRARSPDRRDNARRSRRARLDVNLTGGESGEEDERQQAARQNFFSTKNSVTPAAAAVPAMAYITFARRASEVASEAWQSPCRARCRGSRTPPAAQTSRSSRPRPLRRRRCPRRSR